MNIVNFKHENMSDYGKTTTCNVYSIHVKVDDIYLVFMKYCPIFLKGFIRIVHG